jgi:S1-C subfamily serine protease
VYRAIYGNAGASETEGGNEIDVLLGEAVNALAALRDASIAEGRFDDALSQTRSLKAVSNVYPDFAEKPESLVRTGKLELELARSHLEKKENLLAFLAASKAFDNAEEDWSGDDVRPFLDRAIDLKQKGTVQVFMSTLERLGGEGDAKTKAWAAAPDTVADMLGGVATVLVDRGIKIERGMGYHDQILGSAFFVDESGILVTNHHVIESQVDPLYEGYSRLYIRFGGSSSPRIPAKVLGYDKTLDLALIKAEIKPGYVFSVLNAAVPRSGDTVIAIGSPGGLEKTVTQGIVSATRRGFLQLGDVIQLDAAVNPGNSGGPLVVTGGGLVGIIFAGALEYQGLNFAVPSERLAAAIPGMLSATEQAKRPWLGLTIAENKDGAEIVYVAPLTPAAEQRVREGDIIVKMNGVSIREQVSAHEASAGVSGGVREGAAITLLQDAIFTNRVGELAAIETKSGEKLAVLLAARPGVPLAEAAKLDSKERMAAPLFGLILAPTIGGVLTPSYLVKKVVRGSVADEAGISPKDPVRIRYFVVHEKDGYATMDIDVKKQRQGYLETTMRLPAALESPDTL